MIRAAVILVTLSSSIVAPSGGFDLGDTVTCSLCNPFSGHSAPPECLTNPNFGAECSLCYQLLGPEGFLREICVPIHMYLSIMNTVVQPELERCWHQTQGECALRLVKPVYSSSSSFSSSSTSSSSTTDIPVQTENRGSPSKQDTGQGGSDVGEGDDFVEDDVLVEEASVTIGNVENYLIRNNEVESVDSSLRKAEEESEEDDNSEDILVEEDSNTDDGLTDDDNEDIIDNVIEDEGFEDNEDDTNLENNTEDDDDEDGKTFEDGTSEIESVLFQEVFVLYVDDVDPSDETNFGE